MRKFPIPNVQSHCFFIISYMLPLFGLHMLKTKTCVSQDSKNCFEKQLLLPECNFVPATIFPGFHQPWNVHGSNHCLELIFSFEDTKFKVDHKLSHSSVRRYIRFGNLKHIGKVRLFAILHCIQDFQIEFGWCHQLKIPHLFVFIWPIHCCNLFQIAQQMKIDWHHHPGWSLFSTFIFPHGWLLLCLDKLFKFPDFSPFFPQVPWLWPPFHKKQRVWQNWKTLIKYPLEWLPQQCYSGIIHFNL